MAREKLIEQREKKYKVKWNRDLKNMRNKIRGSQK